MNTSQVVLGENGPAILCIFFAMDEMKKQRCAKCSARLDLLVRLVRFRSFPKGYIST